MRQLFTAFICICIVAVGYGQSDISGYYTHGNINKHKISQNVITHLKSQRNHATTSGPRAGNSNSYLMSYRSADKFYANAIGSTWADYRWDINNSYGVSTTDSTDNFTLKWSAVVFDTLFDSTTMSPVSFAGKVMTIDSIILPIRHINTSGTNDTLIFRVLQLAATPSGLSATNGVLTNTVLKADTFISNTSMTNGQFMFIILPGPFTLPAGEGFAVDVNYFGSKMDTFSVIAGQRDDCFGGCASAPSIYPNNSWYFLNLSYPSYNLDLSGINPVYYDCNHNQTHDPNLCEDFFIQDFWVDFYVTLTTPSVVCPTPGHPHATNIKPTQARLVWDSVSGAHHYAIRGRRLGTTNWLHITAPGNTTFKNVYGLTNNRSYEWQIRTWCNATSDSSAWSAIDTFTTGCYPPTGLYAQPVSSTSARLNWTPASGAVGYRLRGRRLGTSTWKVIMFGSSTLYKDVYGLMPNTSYEWQMGTFCSSSGSIISMWSALDTFTTTTAKMGINETSGDAFFINPVALSPNPMTGNSLLQFDNPDNQNFKIRIFDITGQVVRNYGNVNSNELVIEKGSLTPGVYILKMDGPYNYQQKLMVK